MEASFQPRGEPESDRLEWTVFLLRRHPWRGLFAIAVCAYTVWFIWSFSGSAWLSGLGAFVLLASLSSFFFPTRYRLDAHGVRIVNFLYRRTRSWSEFRGLRRQRDRVKLLTLPYDSRLDNFRGMLLILPDDGDEILAFLRQHIERNAGESA